MPITNKTKAVIESVTQHCHDTKSFTLRPERPFAYTAGQFLMLSVPHNNRTVRRAYSIASAPGGVVRAAALARLLPQQLASQNEARRPERSAAERVRRGGAGISPSTIRPAPPPSPPETVEICLNYLPDGVASEFLFNAKEGAVVDVDGPYGVFTVRNSPNDKLFIATGTGIAPIRAMIHELFRQAGEQGTTGTAPREDDVTGTASPTGHAASAPPKEQITLIFGERTEAELLYREEFEALAKKHSNFRYVPVLSRALDSWSGERGYVQEAMQKYINRPKEADAYICGLKDMVDDAKSKLLAMGVNARNILTERFV